ncbi:MAG: flagellar biosynthetic protein FliR [Planctomycetes bacterium]|nr:flagellar biosynthetic protein FliR [Planctomycetota bacterium]
MNDIGDFLTSPGVARFGQLILLIVLRFVPIIALTPIFGGEHIPRRFQTAVSLCMAGVLVPVLWPTFPAALAGETLALLCLTQVALGVSFALAVTLFFDFAAFCGGMIDTTRGVTFANVLDPLTQKQTSPLASFFSYAVMTLFVSAGGISLLFYSVAGTFAWLPVGRTLTIEYFGESLLNRFLDLTTRLFGSAIQFAAPMIVLMFVIDAAFGALSKAVPRIDVYFLSLPLKATVGLVMLFLLSGAVFAGFLNLSFDVLRILATGG